VVQVLIEENYRRLDRDARRVIEALAVFRKPVPPLAVDYLLEPFAPGLDVPSVVQRLKRTNIVSVDRAAKTVTLHPIDQDYAYSQLPEEDETEADYTRQALERRAANYYVQLRTPEETWESIEDLGPQLNEFEHRVRAGDYDDACRVLNSIDFDHLFLWGHYVRLVKMRERLLCDLKDPTLEMTNLGNLGLAHQILGRIELSIDFCGRARAIAHEINDHAMESTWLGRLGNAYRALGYIERSINYYQKSLTISRQINDRLGEGENLGNLGVSYYSLGRFNQTVKLCEEALCLACEIEHQWLEGIWVGQLGRGYYALGHFERASKLYDEALTSASEIGNRRGGSHLAQQFGCCSSYLGAGRAGYSILQRILGDCSSDWL
jgi:tetratricopeptide (TPR) repeat protein